MVLLPASPVMVTGHELCFGYGDGADGFNGSWCVGSTIHLLVMDKNHRLYIQILINLVTRTFVIDAQPSETGHTTTPAPPHMDFISALLPPANAYNFYGDDNVHLHLQYTMVKNHRCWYVSALVNEDGIIGLIVFAGARHCFKLYRRIPSIKDAEKQKLEKIGGTPKYQEVEDGLLFK